MAVSSVIFHKNSVLLVKRGKEPSMGQWNLPGGAVELGESHMAALVREVHEETGLDITIGELVGAFDRIIKDNSGRVEYHYLILDYWAEAKDVASAKPGSDVQELKWVTLEQINEANIDNAVLKVIQKAVKMRKRSTL